MKLDIRNIKFWIFFPLALFYHSDVIFSSTVSLSVAFLLLSERRERAAEGERERERGIEFEDHLVAYDVYIVLFGFHSQVGDQLFLPLSLSLSPHSHLSQEQNRKYDLTVKSCFHLQLAAEEGVDDDDDDGSGQEEEARAPSDLHHIVRYFHNSHAEERERDEILILK